ncbi:MAG: family 43 glycosylhydrolase [Acidobacteriota bacterium]
MTPTVQDPGPRGRAARGVLALAALACVMAGAVVAPDRPARYRQEGQPAADLGNGLYRNPILAGDYPDPSVVRVGADYYLTHSSGTATPGLLVWHSRDLVNWEPIGHALKDFAGDVWAPDIVYDRGLFFIYFPARVAGAGGKSRQTCFVITSRSPSGPWSRPIDLNVEGIDPGHAADGLGNRYLYVDGGRVIRLARDGLRTEGELRKVYDGWAYPDDWNVECMCLESPKVVARGGYYYLVSAEGGTAGPSTSHMIVVARSKSPAGPWENSPLNPLLRTASRAERWWSQGHGTLIEAADGTWWVMYHGFDNGFRTLGRQTLLMPVEWTADG